ncbi:pectinesterase family protein [Streptomyces geranii]|uniref:pectinesterase family protein n=1 Tax=Streptomyces geranii TaxID=2058923 RepID=UPI000D03779B|nr:pectinesterase family protein [Streptomyces geranii]
MQLPDRAVAVSRKRVQAIAVSLATAVTVGGLVVFPAVSAQAAVSCAAGSWTEQFFANAKLSGAAKKTVCDSGISENWGSGRPAVSGLANDNFSVRWTQVRDFGGGGPFTLTAASQDGVRIYVDGKKILDGWKDVTRTQTKSVAHTFSKGRHTLRVDYFAGRGAANVSVKVTPAATDKVKPNAPVGVKATYAYPVAKLTWSKGPEADLVGYRVYRSTSSNVPLTPANLISGSKAVTATSYSDKPAATGARYYYRLVAVDKSGNVSGGSGVVNVTSKDVTAPAAAPNNVTVTSSGDGNKTAWTKPTTDTVKYRVYRATSATGTGSARLTETAAISFTDTSAAEKTTYYYAVSALDTVGNESARSAWVSGTRPDTTAPATPGTVTATGVIGAVELSWAANSDDTTAYEVWSATSAGGTYGKLATVASPSHSYSDIAAVAGATTYYKVYAVDAAGNVSAASVASGTALAAPDTTAPDAPTGLGVTGGDLEADLSWSASASGDTASYRVYRSTSPDVALTGADLIASGVTGTSYTDTTGLADGTTYHYAVTAVDGSGNESATGATGSAKTLYFAADLVVGKGGYATLQAALNAAPAGATTDVTILVKPGTYTGAVTVPVGKTHLVVVGGTGDASDTVLTESHGVTDTDSTWTTETSATFFANSDDLTVKNLTIANGYTEVAANNNNQAVALRTTGDRQVYDNVRLLGNQDTVYIRESGKRVLIRNSYLEGDTDWLFGAGTAVFQNDEIHYTDSRGKNGGSITAASTKASSAHGFLITGSDITLASGVTSYYLGRPWPQYTSDTAPQVIVRDTGIPKAPTSAWKDWNATYTWKNARYAEYDNTGAGVDNSGTNANRPQLTDIQARQNTAARFLKGADNWDPTGTLAQEDFAAPAAATGLSATVDGDDIDLTWTAPADSDVAGYQVFRSANGAAATLISGDGLLAATAFTDSTAVQGTAYTYTVVTTDTSGNVSDASGSATATVPVPVPVVDAAPAAPTGLTATGAAGKIDLAWTAPADADLAGYRVYRSTSAGVTATAGNLVATGVTAASYSDTSAAFGTTYHYAVLAVDAAGQVSGLSGEVSGSELPVGTDVVVAVDGSGDYTTVSAAVAATTSSGTAANPFVIAVRPGTYRETVTLKNKPYVQIVGTSGDASDATVVYDNASGTVIPGGTATYGTTGSATFTNQSNNTRFENLTISNDFDEAAHADLMAAFTGQAVALMAQGDRQVYDNVRLLGNQDTLYTKQVNAGSVLSRQYFTDSYIEGDVDFICGHGTTVIDDSTIKVLTSRTSTPILSAPQTNSAAAYGFLIADSSIVTDGVNNSAKLSLGRPWSASGQQVIRNTSLPAQVLSAPYQNWNSSQTWQAARFAEYLNTGAGADNTGTNTNRPQLTAANEGTYTVAAYLTGSDGWAPQGS